MLTNANADYQTQLSNNGQAGMSAAYPPDGTFQTYFNSTHWKQDLANANATAQAKYQAYSDLVNQLTIDPSLKNILALIANNLPALFPIRSRRMDHRSQCSTGSPQFLSLLWSTTDGQNNAGQPVCRYFRWFQCVTLMRPKQHRTCLTICRLKYW